MTIRAVTADQDLHIVRARAFIAEQIPSNDEHGLFNGDDLFLIDQGPPVNDHVRAFIDARILLIGHGRVVSAERGTVID